MKKINKLTNGLDSNNDVFQQQISNFDSVLHSKYDNIDDPKLKKLFTGMDSKLHEKYPNLDSNTLYNIVENYNGEYGSVMNLKSADWIPNWETSRIYGYATYAEEQYPVIAVGENIDGEIFISMMLESDWPYEFAKIYPKDDGYVLEITLENPGGYVSDLILYDKAVDSINDDGNIK